MKLISNYKKPILFLILSVAILLISRHVGMFWDNVLFGAKIGKHLYREGVFNWQSIPLNIDNGHPPFLGALLAITWKVFGKSLAVAHWVMLPFIFGMFWQLYSFVDFFIKEKVSKIGAFVLVAADPTLLSQFVLVNPELIQLFFFFLALNSILRHNFCLKTIGLAFLGLVTYRGMMLCGGLFLIDLVIVLFIKKQRFRDFFTNTNLLAYLIALIPASLYIIWRLITKGWLISHPSAIWGHAWEFNTLSDFLLNFGRNILVLGHQFTDFGRILLVIFIIATLYIKRKIIVRHNYKCLLIISILSTVLIYTTSLIIRNTMGHRYYIASYLSLALLAFVLIKLYKFKSLIYVGLLSSLILGNFIVYTDSFAQGWDSSLAHLPYWNLRKKAIKYMDYNNIPISKTASFFPNSTEIDNVDLNSDSRSFRGFSGTENYVFYSNVYNLSDEALEILNHNYHIIKSFKKNNIRIELMEKVTKQKSK
ncbi:glycosyltransferase family 39 protein [Aestuariivivens sediminicola]|uniref:glycosyltransferase family 39 protein n=1 Tax=Aestuariivivens sediminicola TaxID=2913560 RepID=UPI001F57EB42|nr:glycosyltransferase family 39 protein [Aestuariivivens sediminicola]